MSCVTVHHFEEQRQVMVSSSMTWNTNVLKLCCLESMCSVVCVFKCWFDVVYSCFASVRQV